LIRASLWPNVERAGCGSTDHVDPDVSPSIRSPSNHGSIVDRDPGRDEGQASAEPPGGESLTELLAHASGGNADAFNRLFPLVYEELRLLARSRLRAERDGHTLNTTALVHEAYLKLIDQTRVQWQNRAHFFAIASRAMHRILINYAHMRNAGKRGAGAAHVPLEEVGIEMTDAQVDELIGLDQALGRLREFNERGADVVVYRFFGGLTHDEIAEVMGTSTVTVRRSWTVARAWLRRELDTPVPAIEADAGND
jgi:RNA polymerase sigma factor (TIGR02999 family)